MFLITQKSLTQFARHAITLATFAFVLTATNAIGQGIFDPASPVAEKAVAEKAADREAKVAAEPAPRKAFVPLDAAFLREKMSASRPASQAGGSTNVAGNAQAGATEATSLPIAQRTAVAGAQPNAQVNAPATTPTGGQPNVAADVATQTPFAELNAVATDLPAIEPERTTLNPFATPVAAVQPQTLVEPAMHQTGANEAVPQANYATNDLLHSAQQTNEPLKGPASVAPEAVAQAPVAVNHVAEDLPAVPTHELVVTDTPQLQPVEPLLDSPSIDPLGTLDSAQPNMVPNIVPSGVPNVVPNAVPHIATNQQPTRKQLTYQPLPPAVPQPALNAAHNAVPPAQLQPTQLPPAYGAPVQSYPSGVAQVQYQEVVVPDPLIPDPLLDSQPLPATNTPAIPSGEIANPRVVEVPAPIEYVERPDPTAGVLPPIDIVPNDIVANEFTAGAPEPTSDSSSSSTASSSSTSETSTTDWSALTEWTGPEQIESTAKTVGLLTVISLAPAILLMTTSFIRISVVLGLLRQAIGTQMLPSNQIVTSLSMFLTALVMMPVWQNVYDSAIVPYTQQDSPMTAQEAWNAGVKPVRDFMSHQIEMAGNSEDILLFHSYLPDSSQPPQTYDEVPLRVLLPAFMISELKIAFLIGFQIYLPFLIIDLVVSSVTVSMGMMMLPPVTVSLPLKLLLFVLVDGWHLVVGMLLQSFGGFS